MNFFGWLFLGIAWTGIFALVIFCIRKIMQSGHELG